MHYIQKHILKTLMYTKWARFRDMRPPKVDSNAYSYHLRMLQRDGLVEKQDQGYRLSPAGLFYVDKVSMENLEPRLQPKLVTMIVAQNENDEILLFPKTKQPFIGALMLPFGKVHLDDESVLSAARREMTEKTNYTPDNLSHVGDCYIRARIKEQLVWNVLAHVFTTKVKRADIEAQGMGWYALEDLQAEKTTPASVHIIEKALHESGFFFEECTVDW